MDKKRLLFALILTLCAITSVEAQIPQVIAYQGYLSQNGTAYTSPAGGVPVTLILYDDQNAGKQAWSQTFAGVVVSNGYYSVVMDFSSNWQNGYTTFDHQYWLSASVDNQLLSPRVQFTAAPYSFNARIADSAIHIPQAPVGTIVAYGGDIFKLRSNEQKLGWYVCDGRRISVDSFPEYANVVGQTYGVSDAADSVYLPDFRGLFLRGVNSGFTGNRTDSLADPDVNKRFAMNPNGTGNTQSQVGSVQDDAFQGHHHAAGVVGSPASAGATFDVEGQSGGTGTLDVNFAGDVTSDNQHGNARVSFETRPKNAYVYWIIKVK